MAGIKSVVSFEGWSKAGIYEINMEGSLIATAAAVSNSTVARTGIRGAACKGSNESNRKEMFY